MNLHPIQFSGPMVLATIGGDKTMTRRVIRNPEYYGCPTGDCPHGTNAECYAAMNQSDVLAECPYGQPGDVLWAREAWDQPYRRTDCNTGVIYRADGPEYLSRASAKHQWGSDNKWKSPLHMPLWACRLFLRVERVRAERLQDITRGDAMAEGCPFPNMADGPDPREWFRDLWDSINATRGHPWASNPWVWVVTFSVLSTTGIEGLPEQVAALVRANIERLAGVKKAQGMKRAHGTGHTAHGGRRPEQHTPERWEAGKPRRFSDLVSEKKWKCNVFTASGMLIAEAYGRSEREAEERASEIALAVNARSRLKQGGAS